MSTVTIDATAAQWLVAGALNLLYPEDPDDGVCCPVCCGPCAALKQLLDAGQLDDIARGYAEGGWDWWDETADQVNRARLMRAWRLDCCGFDPNAEQVVAILAGTGDRRAENPQPDDPDRLRALVARSVPDQPRPTR